MEILRPDIKKFLGDINAPEFSLAVKNKKWYLIQNSEGLQWPFAFFFVYAAERNDSPEGYVFRFELNNYPNLAPEIAIWDYQNNAVLPREDRPGGRNNVIHLFRSNWEQGKNLYAPYERVSLLKHPDWPGKFGDLCWNKNDSIIKPLKDIYQHLNSDDYEGKGKNVC